MTTLVSTFEAGKIGTRNGAMPGPDYSTPPSKCHVGRKLAAIDGSTCHGCYAVKSESMYPTARKGWFENYIKAERMIAEMPEQWARAMAFQIEWHCRKLGEPYMRWFGAGDLQSVAMLRAIVRVCELTPTIKHWLPTRETSIVKAWRKAGGVEPDNLVIRMSATMIGDAPMNYANTSTVHYKGQFSADKFGHDCPKANKTNPENNCGACRTCWDRSVANVSYQFHR